MAYKSFEEFDKANQPWKKTKFTTDAQCQALYNMQRALGEPIKWPYRQDEAQIEFDRLKALFKPKKRKGGGFSYQDDEDDHFYDWGDFADIF